MIITAKDQAHKRHKHTVTYDEFNAIMGVKIGRTDRVLPESVAEYVIKQNVLRKVIGEIKWNKK
jgi:hypothetical protein